LEVDGLSQREVRKVSESALVSTQLMMPQDANPGGHVFGGTIMKAIDSIAGAVATLHCRSTAVTASIDHMSFLEPVYVGDLLILKASVNGVGNTSLEVGVRIEARDLMSGKVTHTGSSYLTFVALNQDGKPTVVPEILPETEAEKRRYEDAKKRRAKRLGERTTN
jgi:acyl-CoA hydrolase